MVPGKLSFLLLSTLYVYVCGFVPRHFSWLALRRGSTRHFVSEDYGEFSEIPSDMDAGTVEIDPSSSSSPPSSSAAVLNERYVNHILLAIGMP